MQYVSATEAKQELGALLDTAQRMPVIIRKHKRDYAVILSATEYEQLRQARSQTLHELQEAILRKARDQGLTEETLSHILSSEAMSLEETFS